MITASTIAEATAAIQRLNQIKRRHPLAFAVLWSPDCLACGFSMEELDYPRHQCPQCGVIEARTSQRAAVAALLKPGVRRGWLMGGNRSGKSQGMAQVAVAFCLGRDHPNVKLWAERNRLGPELLQTIPKGGCTVWAVAIDSADSRRYLRPKVAEYVPSDAFWRNRGGDGEASVSVRGAGRIVFKNCSQGRDGFQGDSIGLCWFDEEPPGQSGLEVVTEADFRLVDTAGRMLFSMTPLTGWTPLLKQNVKSPSGDSVVRKLDSLDNPHIPRSEMEVRLAKVSAHQREARRRGTVVALEGRVYTDWRDEVHIVQPFEIPADWMRFGALDFGFTHPFCHLWGALDPDGRLYIYREHYQAGWRVSQHAEAIIEAEACPVCWREGFGPLALAEDWWSERGRVNGSPCSTCDGTGHREQLEQRWADPESADGRAELNVSYDLSTAKAPKAVLHGIQEVAERLVIQGDGRPRLMVFSTCSHLIEEVAAYRWKPSRGAEDGKQAPIKTADHAMDALRYLVLGLSRSGY